MARLVLYPQGLLSDDSLRQHCAELVIQCGGDVQRMIDGPSHALAAFTKHLQRARIFDRNEPAMVVLTQTNPVGLKLVGARRTLEAAIPQLRSALWLVYYDPLADPFFFDSATSLGPFDDRESLAPIWCAPEDKRFLVLGPETDDGAFVALRVDALEHGTMDFASGVVRKHEEVGAFDEDDRARASASAETIKPPKLG